MHCRVAVGGGAGNWETCPDAELRPTEGFESIGHAFWFTAVTLTTVGYGDVRRAPQRPPRFAGAGVPRALCPS